MGFFYDVRKKLEQKRIKEVRTQRVIVLHSLRVNVPCPTNPVGRIPLPPPIPK